MDVDVFPCEASVQMGRKECWGEADGICHGRNETDWDVFILRVLPACSSGEHAFCLRIFVLRITKGKRKGI
jgi:hypothetical protein